MPAVSQWRHHVQEGLLQVRTQTLLVVMMPPRSICPDSLLHIDGFRASSTSFSSGPFGCISHCC